MGLTKRVLLIIAGGIAAYKSLDVIRRLREREIGVRCILTNAGSQFVTPLSVASLSGDKAFTELFSLTDEAEMGHIKLSRDADLVVVAPATADLLGKMANGLADDLATTALLATDKPVLIAPAMNPEMWAHLATKRNVEQLMRDGIHVVGPNEGEMACGEIGLGRMAEPDEIVQAICRHFQSSLGALAGMRAIVTSGPTIEAIDPVRFLSNHSSGKQGHAVAKALHKAGVDVTLVSGPVREPAPNVDKVVEISSAVEMLQACEQALPADIAVCVAAVADWRPADRQSQKLKKRAGEEPPSIRFVENPDILKTLAGLDSARPRLVIGFAAETENIEQNAERKLQTKGCDWIVANNVSAEQNTFGGVHNEIMLFRRGNRVETWPKLTKQAVADQLVRRIAEHFDQRRDTDTTP
ncbi:MAG: bifunctional phosphopantothenoylcysteine decarboxylase/phosphopantothenate--cysteine ligase CoaBC [Pseudomonadota bacterium]